MKYLLHFLTPLLIGLWSCNSPETIQIYQSDNLIVTQITKNSFVHISYLQTNDYGKVACNGLVYINLGEAAIIDTPTDTFAASELYNWIKKTQKADIKIVIPTHFHGDCMATLAYFHDENIPSIANQLTIDLTDTSIYATPKQRFTNRTELVIGKSKIKLYYPGPGHTRDNIVAYVLEDKVLFGGCLVKSEGAGKGFIGDADLNEWSTSVLNVKNAFQECQYVIPGHGGVGGTNLLDYTIQLFE